MDEAASLWLDAGEVAVFSAPSPGRDGAPNQDAAAVFDAGPGRAVLAVADGMGGRPAGESASRLVLDRLGRSLGSAGADDALRGPILDGVEAGNRAILELGVGAATTLGVAEIQGGELRPYHVGDSAILVVGQRGRVKLQTVSHSPVGYAVEAGLLDEHEALHHEERHLVSNAVGTPDMRIEVGSPLRLAPRDTVLLATDGVFDNLSLQEIVEGVRRGPLPVVAGALAARCRERMVTPEPAHPSKPDDLTFVLFRPAAARPGSEPHGA